MVCGILVWVVGCCCVCCCKSEYVVFLKFGILKEYKIGFINELLKLKKFSMFINWLFMFLLRVKYSILSVIIGR